MLLWLMNLDFAASGADAPPPVVETPQSGAGRSRRRRRKYVLRIDGRVFEADDEQQAQAILDRVATLAGVAANNRADELVYRALPKAISLGAVKPIALKAPTIEAPGIKVEAAQAAIDRAYADASAAAELRLLLALMAAEEDEEEWLLLH